MLDGFNEIALPYAENTGAGVNVFYPRSWQLFSRTLVRPGVAEKVVELQQRKSDYEWWRRRFDFPFARWSNLVLMMWEVVEVRKAQGMALADRQLRELAEQSPELPRDLGPASEYRNLESMLRDLARAWSESSGLMAQVCQSSKSRYFHFLQPNQYVPGSKPLSEWERSNATTPGPFGDAAGMGYPLLIEAGKRLAESGIPFVDLTEIFSDHSETLYSDNCCHLNDRGYQLLAEKMVSIIAEAISNEGNAGGALSTVIRPSASREQNPPSFYGSLH